MLSAYKEDFLLLKCLFKDSKTTKKSRETGKRNIRRNLIIAMQEWEIKKAISVILTLLIREHLQKVTIQGK